MLWLYLCGRGQGGVYSCTNNGLSWPFFLWNENVTLCRHTVWPASRVFFTHHRIPYNGKLWGRKLSRILRLCGYSRKFSPRNLGAWRPLAQQKWAIRKVFSAKIIFFTNSQKFSPSKVSRYMVHMYVENHFSNNFFYRYRECQKLKYTPKDPFVYAKIGRCHPILVAWIAGLSPEKGEGRTWRHVIVTIRQESLRVTMIALWAKSRLAHSVFD